MTELVLYTYWRSSSAYRVRLALAAKGLALRLSGGEPARGGRSARRAPRAQPHGVRAVPRGGRGGVRRVGRDHRAARRAVPAPPLLPRDARGAGARAGARRGGERGHAAAPEPERAQEALAGPERAKGVDRPLHREGARGLRGDDGATRARGGGAKDAGARSRTAIRSRWPTATSSRRSTTLGDTRSISRRSRASPPRPRPSRATDAARAAAPEAQADATPGAR